MTTDGWKPTMIGIEYFKHNKHEFRIEYPVSTTRPTGNARRPGEPDRWQFVRVELADYMQSYVAFGDADADITVGQLKINMMAATDTEKENHARQAANTHIRNQPAITVRNPLTGQEGPYHIALEDSPILVCLG